jgi:hypothetical protein
VFLIERKISAVRSVILCREVHRFLAKAGGNGIVSPRFGLFAKAIGRLS